MDQRILRLQELFRIMEQTTAEIAAMLIPAPADNDDLKTYTCTDCHQLFQDEREYMDVVCPKCDGHACIQKH